jgi:hypothetical protein
LDLLPLIRIGLDKFKLVFSRVETSLLSVNSEASPHLSKTSSALRANTDVSENSSEMLEEQLKEPRWLASDG